MSSVERRDLETEMECSRADDEIFERDHVACRRLLSFNSACELSNLQRQRINTKYPEDSGRKRAPTLTMTFVPGPKHSMREFNSTDGRDTDLRIAASRSYAAQDVRRRLTGPLFFNNKAGVEDQSQPINPTPIGRLACDFEQSPQCPRRNLRPSQGHSLTP